MKILVTGGRGYIGQKLVGALSAEHDVTLLGRHPAEGLPFLRSDIRDERLDLSEYDVIFHLAAISSPRKADTEQALAWDVNVNGTLNLAKKLARNQMLVFMSSAHVYDTTSSLPHKEDEPLRPGNLYGLTKLIGEQIINYYSSKTGYKSCIFRPFNIYSENQPPGLLVGDVIEKCMKNRIIDITNPLATVDMVHLDDAIRVLSSFDMIGAGTYNLCSGYPITVQDIYKKIASYTGNSVELKPLPGATKSLVGDNSKLRTLGFSFGPFALKKVRN